MKASFKVERQKLALCVRFSKDCVFLRKIVQGFSSGWYVFVFVILLCLVSIVFYHPSWKRRSFYFVFVFVFVSPWLEEACLQQVHKPLLYHYASPGMERWAIMRGVLGSINL